MKIMFRRYQPKTHKERVFQVEAVVQNDLKNPIQAYVMLDGKEYENEIQLGRD